MNIKFKRFLRMALCLLLCAVFFTGGVFAAGKLQKRKITVYSGVDIYVDDARLDARDANGNPVEVFIYNGTTYLPVRAVGEAVGKAVQWEAKTSSVYIGQHKSDKPAVWLDEFDYFSSTNHALEKYSRDISDNLGTAYEHVLYQKVAGYGYASTGDTVYQLNGQYSAISGVLFRTYNCRSESAVSDLKIYGDGELLYSASVTKGVDPVEFYIDLTGVLELKIACGDSWTINGKYAAGLGNCGLWA